MGGYFIDTTQADYWFQKLLGLSVQPGMIEDEKRIFMIKSFALVFVISVLWWVVREIWPGIIGGVLSIIFFGLIVYLTYFYLRFVNQSKGLVGLLLSLIPLFLIVVL